MAGDHDTSFQYQYNFPATVNTVGMIFGGYRGEFRLMCKNKKDLEMKKL